MKGFRTVAATMIMVVALGLTACYRGGPKLESQQSSYGTTLGQELKDLDESYQKGIITKDQYESAKKKIIEQRTKK